MTSSTIIIKERIMTHLMIDYKIIKSDAAAIYDATFKLYHEILTLVDLQELQQINEKLLSSLLIMIMGNIDDDSNINPLYIDVIIYIIFHCNSINIQFVFNNWITFLSQQTNVVNGIKSFQLILSTLYNYVNKSKFDTFNDLYDILKSLRNNINSLEKKTKKNYDIEQTNNMNEVRHNFDLFLLTNNIILSDESDVSDDDDDDTDYPNDKY